MSTPQTQASPPSAPDSAARGTAARSVAPRSSHGVWEAASDRPDPIATLQRQARTRTRQLVPIRYGRMLSSPFAFYRGAAAIMAADLAPTPRTGFDVQLCGDAHIANFGAFAAPDRRLVFDLNDFDETFCGPWEWDVKRLAASIAVLGRDRGFTPTMREDMVAGAVRRYRTAMLDFAGQRTLDVWYARMDVDDASAARRLGSPTGKQRKDLDKGLAKARRKDSLRALSKLTNTAGGTPQIISDPPIVVPLKELLDGADEATVRAAIGDYLARYKSTLEPYRRLALRGYRVVDVAHKVVGVGSVGTRTWIVLLLGRDATDPLFLQLKEAGPSVLAQHLGGRAMQQGRRVVEGQRIMQATGDLLLGWLRMPHDLDGHRRDYYVRQLWDQKGTAPLELLTAGEVLALGEACGWTLARAHARSGDREAIAAYLGAGDRFDRALARFAETYADQNERDHAALADAVAAGRIAADVTR
jgi:uncharacterized protein (DUF2252 family)